MIWFFLAGMIAGAIGMIMYARYYIQKHSAMLQEEETPYDVMRDFLHTMETKKFKTGEEALQYMKNMNERMDNAIKRSEEHLHE